MSVFLFLPITLRSEFIFPFRGMPDWAQRIGETLPMTHCLRMVRGIMLKGADLSHLAIPLGTLALFTLVSMAVAVNRFSHTLD
ncbi:MULTISPECIES: ABC transporter permease [Chelativorans]|uniref:ABC transporter permease n=1 Tax=Chelativorans intermedius TaxID=515947 RepID=A0ABV6DCP8_9HYPH|nr:MULTISPECIES: hypothetical protein [Chelativorans]MCT9000584.1 hypothetical protein [Chelativorans intermedius]WEX12169.1 hypothetical protein PVE73_25935 [Chelativorans sp. AA-79]